MSYYRILAGQISRDMDPKVIDCGSGSTELIEYGSGYRRHFIILKLNLEDLPLAVVRHLIELKRIKIQGRNAVECESS